MFALAYHGLHGTIAAIVLVAVIALRIGFIAARRRRRRMRRW